LTTDALDSWAPNIATESISVFVTVVVVGALLRREERRRRDPRVKRAIRWTAADFELFMDAVLLDYVSTRVATYRQLPGDAVAMLDQWLEDQPNEDWSRSWIAGEDVPDLVTAALAFADNLRWFRETDLEVMEDEFAYAVDQFAAAATRAVHFFGMTRFFLQKGDSEEEEALRPLIEAARNFAVVLRPYAPHALELSAESLEAAEAEHNRRLRITRRRGGN
jgi:hypothetical protein